MRCGPFSVTCLAMHLSTKRWYGYLGFLPNRGVCSVEFNYCALAAAAFFPVVQLLPPADGLDWWMSVVLNKLVRWFLAYELFNSVKFILPHFHVILDFNWFHLFSESRLFKAVFFFNCHFSDIWQNISISHTFPIILSQLILLVIAFILGSWVFYHLYYPLITVLNLLSFTCWMQSSWWRRAPGCYYFYSLTPHSMWRWDLLWHFFHYWRSQKENVQIVP